jgi:hypothetical protein
MSATADLKPWNVIRQLSGLDQIKQAFVDPASMAAPPPAGGMPMGQPIPIDPAAMGGGAPPIDPAAMGGAPPIDPAAMMGGGAPPIDPAMMGGAPPVDPAAMMGGAPPVDPSAEAMGGQEAMRSIIREEIQKAMGGGDAGQGGAAPAKKGGKVEDAIGQLKQEMQQQMKVFVAALRRGGVEIPLADLFSLENGSGQEQGSAAGQPQGAAAGISETLQPGTQGGVEDGGVGKVASLDPEETEIKMLQKLACAKDVLKTSVLGARITKFNPQQADITFLNGLYS